jgi:hypothetical protein
MASLNESIVEDAALEWLGEIGYAAGHGPHLAPGEPAAGRDPFGAVVLAGRLRGGIQQLSLAKSGRTHFRSSGIGAAISGISREEAAWSRP